MKAVGIIAEYNPLHYGHIHHINKAIQLAGSDAVVVAMSGDYIQRGEPAILDKWERCELALKHGADLVIEIPAVFCLSDASTYAKAGVALLENIPAVNSIAFGSECGDVELLEDVASKLQMNSKEIKDRISQLTKGGISFPRARESAFRDMFGKAGADVLSNSNDIRILRIIIIMHPLKPSSSPTIANIKSVCGSEIKLPFLTEPTSLFL